jgi:flavodoxin
MKVLITYFSQTGNTEKVAHAIHDAIAVEKDMVPIAEVQSTEGYDAIFCGFPVHAHSVPVPVQEFIKTLAPDTKIAMFATHGSLTGGELAVTAIEHAVTLASKLKVLGTFGCRGQVDRKILETLAQKPEHQVWVQMAKGAANHPDESDLADAKVFARSMVAKAAA